MKRLRIRTDVGNSEGGYVISTPIKQHFDVLEILSLSLTQSEAYKSFSSDYGVLAGRIIANGGFGVPNAKISVFIPLANNESPKVQGLYPYRTVNDTNSDGLRYNLLPNTKQGNCHTPVGGFPSKRQVLDNKTWLEIYDKYYKFTTVSNESGDYMITGIPVGIQSLHMDVDLSDIGVLSQKPYDLILQGAPRNQFASLTTFKNSNDLDSLSQVFTQNTSVEIAPFWGENQSNVGITRLDFKLNKTILANSLFFGSIFSDDDRGFVNQGCRPRKRSGNNCNFETGEGSIEAIRKVSIGDNTVEYFSLPNSAQIDENGNWAAVLPMNLNRVVTDEFGNTVPSEDPTIGVPTSAFYRFRIGLSERTTNFRIRSGYYLVPNMYNRFDFDSNTNDDDFYEMKWNKIYTVANYIPRYQKNQNNETRYFTGIKKIGDCEQVATPPFNRIDTNFNPIFNLLCILLSVLVIILNFIDNLMQVILFGVIQKFICLINHPFNKNQRSACRCRACRDLFRGASNTGYPPDWNGSVDNNSNGIDDRIECADCYSGGDDDDISDCPSGSTVDGNCDGLCQTCEFTLVELNCNGQVFTNYIDWKDCTIQQLAEDLNVVTYEFYNDWVIGSLYSFLFKYRVRLKRNGKEIERFCDFDCGDTTGEHRKNKCRSSYIKFKDEFGNSNAFDINGGDGLGLITEKKNFLYYAARHDGQQSNLSVSQKDRLLFATQIVPLGSRLSCDSDGDPYLIDNIIPSSYQDSIGVQTLFNGSTCLSGIQDINTEGIPLISQAGIEIRVEEQQDVNDNTFTGVDGENYTAYNPAAGLVVNLDLSRNPDFGNQNGYIIFDRDIEIRKYLCENFNYFNTSTTYNTTNYPSTTYSILDGDGDAVEYTYDECQGFNDKAGFNNVNDRIHPYYLFFGITKGKTSLDKLKNQYFDNCIS